MTSIAATSAAVAAAAFVPAARRTTGRCGGCHHRRRRLENTGGRGAPASTSAPASAPASCASTAPRCSRGRRRRRVSSRTVRAGAAGEDREGGPRAVRGYRTHTLLGGAGDAAREEEEDVATRTALRTDLAEWISNSTVRSLFTSSPFLGYTSAAFVVLFKHVVIETREGMRNAYAAVDAHIGSSDALTHLWHIDAHQLVLPPLAVLGPVLAGVATALLQRAGRFGPGLTRMERELDGVIDEFSTCYGDAAAAAEGDDAAAFIPEARNVVDAGDARDSGGVDIPASARRFAATALSLAGGLSLGPEAPSAEIGGTLGLIAGQSLDSPQERRMLLAAGAAAGVAAAFHAPFAGALYAVELVLKRKGLNRVSLSSVFVSVTVSATLVTQFEGMLSEGNVGFPLEAAYVPPLDATQFLLCGGLGAAVAAAASTLYAMIRVTRARVADAPLPTWVALPLGGLAVGTAAAYFPVVSYGTVPLDSVLSGAFAGRIGLAGAAACIAVKVAATALSKGAGFAGGLFAPTLVIGGLLGSAYWDALAGALPAAGGHGEASQFALLGAGAMLASVCKVPLTATAMLIELSRSPALLVPMMATSGVAVILTERIELGMDVRGLPGAAPEASGEIRSLRALSEDDGTCQLTSLDETGEMTCVDVRFRDTVEPRVAARIMRERGLTEALVVDGEGETVSVIRIGAGAEDA